MDVEKELKRLRHLMAIHAEWVCFNWKDHQFCGEENKGKGWRSYPSGSRCWDMRIANDWWCPSCICARAFIDPEFNVGDLGCESHYPEGTKKDDRVRKYLEEAAEKTIRKLQDQQND